MSRRAGGGDIGLQVATSGDLKYDGSRKEPFMRRIDRQIEKYLNYCEWVRGMSPVTINTKRYTLNDFVRETGLKNLRSLQLLFFHIIFSPLRK